MPRFAILVLAAAALGGAAAAAPEGSGRKERTFVFVYECALANVPDGAKQARLWIPVPESGPDQEVSGVDLSLTVDGRTSVAKISGDGTLRNASPLGCTLAPIGHGRGRTLCVESEGKPFSVRMTVTVTRRETTGGGAATPEELEALTGPDRMVPLGGKASSMAAGIPDGKSARETAKAIYDHVLERMRYDKPQGQPWGRGDAEWACESCYGNCTDFHSYFMAIARTKGIPTRFEMGFSVPGGAEPEASIGGYHCWAFFWDGAGWVPVDISEADRNPEKAAYFFGALDADRVTFTGGRDLELTPAPAAGTLNFLVYPHAEVDGTEWKDVTRSFKRILPPG